MSICPQLSATYFPPTYRWPMQMTEVRIYQDDTARAQCPRCKGIIEYKYQFFHHCYRQRLDLKANLKMQQRYT